VSLDKDSHDDRHTIIGALRKLAKVLSEVQGVGGFKEIEQDAETQL